MKSVVVGVDGAAVAAWLLHHSNSPLAVVGHGRAEAEAEQPAP
jgi:hypothetical protein